MFSVKYSEFLMPDAHNSNHTVKECVTLQSILGVCYEC